MSEQTPSPKPDAGVETDDLLFLPDDDTEVVEASASGATEEDEVATLRAELEAARAERDDFKDRLVRRTAELENSRKRHTKERDDLQKYAAESVLKEMVSVLDDLDRALEHINAQTDQSDETLQGLIKGVEMVHRKFVQTMERRGVVGFSAIGATFDPNLHEAIQQVDDPSVPNNTVIREFQKGYMLAARLLRPSMVVVAKGGAAVVEPPTDSSAHGDPDDVVLESSDA